MGELPAEPVQVRQALTRRWSGGEPFEVSQDSQSRRIKRCFVETAYRLPLISRYIRLWN